MHEDFPGGPGVRNLPCNARDMGWISGRETKIAHAHTSLVHAAVKDRL